MYASVVASQKFRELSAVCNKFSNISQFLQLFYTLCTALTYQLLTKEKATV